MVIPRKIHFPQTSFFLFGPRGTGKSTWIKVSYPKALFVDLLDPEQFRLLSARPERLKEMAEGSPEKNIVVIDEVQKIPEMLDVVHLLMESGDKRQFILTGSSPRKLKKIGIDLLAGRAVRVTMHPFTASELGSSFDLERSLVQGLLPVIASSSDPLKALKAYCSLYVQEEVPQEGLVRNIGAFNRFLESVSFSHGSIINISNIGRECGVERKTIEGYLGVLEDLMLAYRLPSFSRRAKRETTLHPKFFFFDTGVFRTFRPAGPLDKIEEIGGAGLEGLVFQHLLAWNFDLGEKFRIHYWRTKHGLEVDFVVYGPGAFYAIEVKNTKKINERDLSGLLAFQDDFPGALPVLVYRGKEKLKIRGVLCLPCEEFLKTGLLYKEKNRNTARKVNKAVNEP